MAARIRCIRAYCTCRQQLGKKQTEFEIRTLQGEEPVEILDKMGFIKMCCRVNMLYPPTFPILDTNEARLMDETGFLEKESLRRFSYIDGPELFLDNVPPFPEF